MRSHKFWDRIAERYASKPVPDEAVYQQKLRKTREYFHPDMQVLEIGCGTGSTAIAHAPHVGQILATDVSPKMIEIARGKAAEAGVGNVRFEALAVEDIDLPDASVDAVLALSLLHLLEDRDNAIAGMYRLLRPGGVFVSSTACIADRMPWFRWVGPVGRWLGLMPLVRVFSETQLERSLQQAGFNIDYRWRPEKAVAAFIVARKTGCTAEDDKPVS